MKNFFGRIVMTNEINNTIAESEKFSNEVLHSIVRYIKEDWGEMCEKDKNLNDEALKNANDRIVAAYETSKGKIYIITEWDRSATTVLFSNEY